MFWGFWQKFNPFVCAYFLIEYESTDGLLVWEKFISMVQEPLNQNAGFFNLQYLTYGLRQEVEVLFVVCDKFT